MKSEQAMKFTAATRIVVNPQFVGSIAFVGNPDGSGDCETIVVNPKYKAIAFSNLNEWREAHGLEALAS